MGCEKSRSSILGRNHLGSHLSGKDNKLNSSAAAPAQRNMPPAALTAEEQAEAKKKASSDLLFLFSRNDVDGLVVARFCHAGVTTIEKFANIAKDAEDLNQVLKDYIGVDPSASLEERVKAASVQCAWANSVSRTQKAAEMEAEMDTKEHIKPIVSSEWLGMRMGLEKVVGHLEDRVAPAKEYIEKKLQDIEAGEYRAEALTEIVSREEVDPDAMLPQWDAKGVLTMKKGSTTVKEPEHPEALRRRLTVLRHAMMMIALKHTNRAELQGDHAKVIEEYKDYLLGDYVYGLNAKDAEGNTIAAPPFRLVISYERAIRKEAVRRMNQEAEPWCIALKKAWRDPTVKERHFTTPLALYSKRPAKQGGDPDKPPWKKTKGDREVKGAGKGKGKQLPGCATHTEGGEPICFRYNTPKEKCKEKKCRFRHVCGICFGKHPMFQCNTEKRQPGGGDTQGSA